MTRLSAFTYTAAKRLVLAGVLLISTPMLAAAQVGTLRPADEAVEDPSFFLFRLRLLEALARQDTTFLYEHTASDVHVSFGIESGLEGLKSLWRPDTSGSLIWPTLARVLGGGGRFQDGRFVAPYVFTDFPPEIDAFTHQVVMGDTVRVRVRPSRESEVLGMLSYAIVSTSGEEAEGWTKMQLADERMGYIASEYLGSPVGYRAGFEKREGRWVMVFFVAGD